MLMSFRKFGIKYFVLALAVLIAATATGYAGPKQKSGVATPPRWEYNPGPDPSTPMGRALIDINAELPEYMAMSHELMQDQKFRYIFGMMLTRTRFESNAVKVLFIGQDATHIAEASKQPGTSGFGGRVQSIGNYFGVDQSIATTNAFVSTIKGQYGSFDHVFIEFDKDEKPQIKQSAFVDAELWLLANSRKSEILIKREQFWEWMIKNNPESLGLMVMFGGAARDAFGEFLAARGAIVGTKTSTERLKNIQMPESRLVFAGGNNEFAVLIDKDGNDLYEQLMFEKYGEKGLATKKFLNGYGKLDYSKPEVQQEAVAVVKEAGQKAIDRMVFTGGGIDHSGIIHAAQLGGYDLDNVIINGETTNSLRGLRLSDGTVVERDIAFTMSPHPSALSKMAPKAAAASLKKTFGRLKDLAKRGWRIKPDLTPSGKPMRNLFDEGEDPKYERAEIRPGYFEFGTADDRLASRADASRLDPQSIIIGTRERATFDKQSLEQAKTAMPASPKDPDDLWSVRPRQMPARYEFDRGPGEEIAKLIMESIDFDKLFEPKPGMQVIEKGEDATFETHGIDAFYTKTAPSTGVFGIHRGSFETSRALILADPQGLDDWNTSRALTGTRGQYLHGLMEDLGYGKDYLVLKTVPLGMDGATTEEWNVVRERTESYREVAIKKALENKNIEVIFTDGDIAKVEMNRILKKLGRTEITVININRNAQDLSAGLTEAAASLGRWMPKFAGKKIRGQMADIPRAHLPWWSRTWEGTSGDRVIDAQGKYRGGARLLVTPNWVVKQKVNPSDRVLDSILAIKADAERAGIRLDHEEIKSFIERRSLGNAGLVPRTPSVDCEAPLRGAIKPN